METVIRIVAGFLLFAHGLVHLLYLAPEADDPSYPFTLETSWLLPESARRPVALALMTATVGAFALLAMAVWGVPGLSALWPVIAAAASILSLALLIAFWDTRLLFGVVIDLAVIVVAVVRPGWTDAI
ncbi:MAG: hypothetical protein EHM57_06545 [Actinobacteria bacterium]|nr:MAG: hypothetical protein EHM57_06545 [Actinomycetota bacterium]